jgi:hypothetical protein
VSADLTVKRIDRTPELLAELVALERGVVTVGWHQEGKARLGEGDATNAQIAASHEFGTRTIPRRPMLGPALRDGKAELTALQVRVVALVINLKMPAEVALALLGELGLKLLQDRIRSNVPPPLDDDTIKAKGSSNTLIHTGEMLRAASYEVDLSGGTRA